LAPDVIQRESSDDPHYSSLVRFHEVVGVAGQQPAPEQMVRLEKETTMNCIWIGYVLGPAFLLGGIGSTLSLWWKQRERRGQA
jgi:hypothetical protein